MVYCETNNKTMEARIKSNDKLVYIKRNIKEPCPNCEYDVINKESKNLACQTCGGSGFIIDVKFVKIPATVSTTALTSKMIEAGVSAVDTVELLLMNDDWKKYRNYLKSQHRFYINKKDEYEVTNIKEHGPGGAQMCSIVGTKVVAPTRGVE